LAIPELTAAEAEALDTRYRTTRDVRPRTRAQIVLLAGEQRLTAPAIARIVRESDQPVRVWLKRWLAEGLAGLQDRPMPGGPRKITADHREPLLAAVRQRPRCVGRSYSMWTSQRLADLPGRADRTPPDRRDGAPRAQGGRHRPQPSPAHGQQPRPRVSRKKTTIEQDRDHLAPGDAFYYADEFNLRWLPTLRAMWSPKGQQVMIPTPGQPDKYYDLGAVNDHTGETMVHFERRKRRKEIAALLTALLARHPTGTVYVAWDNVGTHKDDEVADVVRPAGRLVLLYPPTYSPWLNPIEMLWHHFRCEVTHCACFATKQALLTAAKEFFTRHNQQPHTILSGIGSKARKSI